MIADSGAYWVQKPANACEIKIADRASAAGDEPLRARR
jgi:hypothetical protein